MKDIIARAAVRSLRDVQNERDRRYAERFAAQEAANKIALEAAEKAVLKAENAADKRFDGVNEFRQTLTDQAATFATRPEMDALFKGVNTTLSRLENLSSANTGKGIGMSQLWGWLVAGASLLLLASDHLTK